MLSRRYLAAVLVVILVASSFGVRADAGGFIILEQRRGEVTEAQVKKAKSLIEEGPNCSGWTGFIACAMISGILGNCLTDPLGCIERGKKLWCLSKRWKAQEDWRRRGYAGEPDAPYYWECG